MAQLYIWKAEEETVTVTVVYPGENEGLDELSHCHQWKVMMDRSDLLKLIEGSTSNIPDVTIECKHLVNEYNKKAHFVSRDNESTLSFRNGA